MKITLLYNGHIYTGDPQHPWAQSLAIAGEEIVAWDEAARPWAEMPEAALEDLDGATVIPGLTDAHIHLLWYALSLRELDLRDLSREAMLACVAEQAAALSPGAWITGRGWDQNLWADSSFPTAAELDTVAPEHPVALIAKNAHALVANSAALRLAGIDAATPDPPRGQLLRAADGTPTGVCFEYAMELIEAAIPALPLAEVVDALDVAQTHLLAAGITGVHCVDGAPAFAALQALRETGRQRVRVVKYVRLEAFDGVLAAGLRSGFGDDWLRFGGLKLFVDGALGSRTAALLAPYAGEPDNLGLLTLPPDELREIARRAVAGGVALAIHAIGDRANRLVLDVLAEVVALASASSEMPLRHRIEHVQLIDPADQPRLAELGVVASMQPIHAPHDHAMADRYWGERAAHAYAWRSLLNAGAVLAFGADAPIEIFDPFVGLYAAVTRRAAEGAPGPAGWRAEQCLSLEEALHAYTEGAAYAAGLETRLGRLAPGYLADLLVLDRDIFAGPPETLLEVRPVRVMVGGVWQLEETL